MLPEAQLDRFIMRLSLGYPNPPEEKTILTNLQREHPITHLNLVDTVNVVENLKGFQRQVWEVHVDDTLKDYIVRLVGATRQHADLALGGSTRASLALFKTAQAYAAIQGRNYVTPDDIKHLVPFVLTHRLIVRPESELRGRTAQSILRSILEGTTLDVGSLES